MSNNGVKFERAIVDCYNKQNFSAHTDDVQNATRHLMKIFPTGTIKHRDDVSLKGKGLGREVKADFWINGQGVSVKMEGAVQLSSAEGKRTADILTKVGSQLSKRRSNKMKPLIEQIEQIPRIMVSSDNREKAMRRKPHLVPDAGDYDAWKKSERPAINKGIRELFKDTKIKEAVVEEMLTGRQQFAKTVGIADYILTPKYCQYIDKKYVHKVAQNVKIDVRGKSRAGISSGVVRFDTKI